MELREIEPGIYQILKSDLPEGSWFIRNSEKPQVLLHVCARVEPEYLESDYSPEATYVVTTDRVHWDYVVGAYVCYSCDILWKTEEELEWVWEDGYGTGYEGYA